MGTHTVDLHHRAITVEVTPAAERALAERATPLLAELELYFSCLVRKRVLFRDADDEEGAPIDPHLRVRLHPVMSEHCAVSEAGNAPPLTDFPIEQPARYVPQWLHIDYRGGRWRGEFGYTASRR